MKPLDRPEELRAYYRSREVVERYLERRTSQPLNGYLHNAEVRFLNEAVRRCAPKRILEIASGPARLTAELEFPGQLVAVDASPAMLLAARARLRERGRNWPVIRGDAFRLPFSDGTFEMVYTLKFIRHFQLEDRNRLYQEIRRVLVPGGSFILDAQNRSVSLPHRRQKGLHRYPIYDVLYDEDEIRNELELAGFRVSRMQGILYRFATQMGLNRLRRVGLGAPARLMIGLLDRVPGGQASTWMLLNETT